MYDRRTHAPLTCAPKLLNWVCLGRDARQHKQHAYTLPDHQAAAAGGIAWLGVAVIVDTMTCCCLAVK